MSYQGPTTDIQLPNLPGVRKGPLETPPKIYSKSRLRGGQEIGNNQGDRSQAELTAERIEEIVKSNSSYPVPATS